MTLSSGQRSLAIGVILAALLIGAFAAGQGSAPAADAAAAGGAAGRITVSGTGTVSSTPGQLSLSIGVQTDGPSAATALQRANHAVRAVTQALRRGGVRAADIQTSGLSIGPTYGSSAAPTGYEVSETVQVTLRDLAKAGTQISTAARAGGNATVVNGVSLSLGDTSPLLATARARAVADARARAAAYARALGRGLGPVITLSEQRPAQPVQVLPLPARAAASVPVHPGTRQLTVTVTAVFALS